MTRRKASMTPFDSKVKEVSRNARMIAENIESSVNTVAMLAQFSQDLEILSMELDLDPMERKAMKQAKGQVEEKMSQVLGHLVQAQKLCEEVASALPEQGGYGPYMGRAITNPFTPIFSGKLANRLIKLGHVQPELRPHLREILKHLEVEE
jgi:hypothetical protein